MKPENCFRVRRDGDDDFIKLLDFGIAKLLDNDTAVHTRLTESNSVIGTCAYMSFEQVAGLDCDHRADIWAVGVMLYEMLTGFLPFVGQNQGQIWTSIFKDEPIPLRDVAPDAEIPEFVEEIVLRALAKNRSARFASTEEFLEALLGLATTAQPAKVVTNTSQLVDVESRMATERVDPKADTDPAVSGERCSDGSERGPDPLLEAHLVAPAPRDLSPRSLIFLGGCGAAMFSLAVALSGSAPTSDVPRPERSVPTAPQSLVPDVSPHDHLAEIHRALDERVQAKPVKEPEAIGPTIATKAKVASVRRNAYQKRVERAIPQAMAASKSHCGLLSMDMTIEINVAAVSGRVVNAQAVGSARYTQFAMCAERELKEFLFPPGDASEPYVRAIVSYKQARTRESK